MPTPRLVEKPSNTLVLREFMTDLQCVHVGPLWQNNENPTPIDDVASMLARISPPPTHPHKAVRIRYNARRGSVAERFKAPVLKTGEDVSPP